MFRGPKSQCYVISLNVSDLLAPHKLRYFSLCLKIIIVKYCFKLLKIDISFKFESYVFIYESYSFQK